MSPEAIRFQRSPSTLWREVGDLILLAPQGRDDFDQLSGPAATAWLLLEEPRSLEELMRLLGDLYGTAPEAIATDVRQLVDGLVGRGSIEEV